MWNLFFLLLTFFSLGVIVYYALQWLKDPKSFDFWTSLGGFLVTLFIGAIAAIVIALSYRYTWVMWVAMAAAGFLRNYWMAWLYKKRG
jgi:hypothetical protein